MIHRMPLAAFAVLALAAISADAQDGKKPADKDAIQGIWTAKKGDKSIKLTFAAEKFTLAMGDDISIEGSFKTDPSKTPKHIDMTVEKVGGPDADDNVKKHVGKTSKAIYEFDGDRLKWLAPEPGNDVRPTAFPQDGEQTKGIFVTFDREKK